MNIIKSKVGQPININNPFSKGLIHYLALSEGAGTRANDSVRNANGIITGYDWVNGGLYRIGLNNQVVDLPTGWLPLDGKTAFTIVANVRSFVMGADGGIFYTHQHSGGEPLLLWLDNASPDHVGALVSTSAGTTGAVYSGLIPLANIEYVIALTWDGVILRLFIDGIEDTTNDFPVAIGGTLLASGSHYRWCNDSGLVKELEGWFKYGIIYNRALTPTEVNSLYVNPYQMFYHSPVWMFDFITGVIEAVISLNSVATISTVTQLDAQAVLALDSIQIIVPAATMNLQASILTDSIEQIANQAFKIIPGDISLNSIEQINTLAQTILQTILNIDSVEQITTLAQMNLFTNLLLNSIEQISITTGAIVEAGVSLNSLQVVATDAQLNLQAIMSLNSIELIGIDAQAVLQAALSLGSFNDITIITGALIEAGIAVNSVTQISVDNIKEIFISLGLNSIETIISSAQGNFQAGVILDSIAILNIVANTILQAGFTLDSVQSITIVEGAIVVTINTPASRTIVITNRDSTIVVPNRDSTIVVPNRDSIVTDF
ncbi:hypothetical protein KAR91_48700 [Candidatus Pacearchaeota archaeon]|nr:hypothetical protein [Candidatus Pacearchaeota archaeon]